MDSGEDARKKRQTKRDCTEVMNEKPKKLKKDATTNSESGSPNEKPNDGASVKVAKDASEGSPNSSSSPTMAGAMSNAASERSASAKSKEFPQGQRQDLESALSCLTITEKQEPISDEAFLSFRLGHAGDASTIALWYRECKRKINKNGENQGNGKENTMSSSTKENAEASSSSSLEIWLEKGLGNEDTPPSLFALLGHVKLKEVSGGTNSANKLAAVALLTLAWENSKRVLRVEWFQVDTALESSPVVERRMWLRLAALSLMTACDLHAVEQSTTDL